MRIIVPNYRASDRFVDNVASALEDMGHDVRTCPAPSTRWLDSRVRGMLLEVAQRAGLATVSPQERWLVTEAKRFRPDLVLALTQALTEETLHALRVAGVPRLAAWWGDSPGNMRQMGLFVKGWDVVFLKDPDGVRKFRRVGLNAHLLHEACNPRWHRPVSTQENDNVVLAGNFYAFRQALVLKLIEANVPVELYGGRLPLWVHPEIRRRHTGRYVEREEKSRVFGAAMACLNSTQIVEGNSLNCRAFEIAAAGGLQVMEYRPIISDCFEPGKEILVFDTFDELLEHLERARKAPGEMAAIREAGARRAMAEHTYERRLKRVLAMTGGHGE